jgi:hypothetical protein
LKKRKVNHTVTFIGLAEEQRLKEEALEAKR